MESRWVTIGANESVSSKDVVRLRPERHIGKIYSVGVRTHETLSLALRSNLLPTKCHCAILLYAVTVKFIFVYII